MFVKTFYLNLHIAKYTATYNVTLFINDINKRTLAHCLNIYVKPNLNDIHQYNHKRLKKTKKFDIFPSTCALRI